MEWFKEGLVIFMISYSFLSCVKSDDLPYCQGLSEPETRCQTLLTALKKSPSLDMLFILDRSGSVAPLIETMKNFVKDFIRFVHDRGIYIHPNHTRVAVQTFASEIVTEFSFMTEYTACQIDEYIDSIKLVNGSEKTDILAAFNAAAKLLEKSLRKSIVVLMFDGHYEHVDHTYIDKVRNMSNQLKKEKVDIFTVGVWYYVKNSTLVDRVKELASSSDHFACLKNWTEVLSSSQACALRTQNHAALDLLQELAPEQMIKAGGKCPQCGSNAICTCDVVTKQFQCACPPGTYPSKQHCLPCEQNECKMSVGKLGLRSSPCDVKCAVTAGVVCTAVLLGLVALAVLLHRRWRRENPQPAQRPAPTGGEPPTPPATMPRYPPIPPPRDDTADGVASHIKSLFAKENQFNMQLWASYLASMVDSSDVEAIGMFNLEQDNKNWARTEGLTIQYDDVITLSACAFKDRGDMVWRTTVLEHPIIIGDKTFVADDDCSGSLYLWLYEVDTAEKVVCLRVQSRFLVMALGNMTVKYDCLEQVKEICDHL